jgi:hypothetical protein
MLKVFLRIKPHGKRAAGPRRIINFNLWRKGDSSIALPECDCRNGQDVFSVLSGYKSNSMNWLA